MRLAVREPQRVHRMVLLCTSASTDPTHFRERAAAVRRGGTAPLAPAVVSRWVTPAFAAAHPEVMRRLEAMVAGADDEGYAACCEVVADLELRADLAGDPSVVTRFEREAKYVAALAHPSAAQPAGNFAGLFQSSMLYFP